jgi:cytochrome c peroxidase
MNVTPKWIATLSLFVAGLALVAGCAQKKKPDVVSPNSTEPTAVVEEEAVVIEEAAPAESKDMPAEKAAPETSEAPPAPEEKPAPEAPAAPPVPEEKPAAEPAPEEKPAEPAAEEKPAEPAAEEKADTPAAEPAAAKAESADGKLVLGADELFAGIPGDGDKATIDQIKAWLDDPKNHEPLDFVLPMGLAKGAGEIKGITENPLTRAKIELGRQLYFDPRLSADFSVSCAFCHDPDEGFARHTQFGVGIKEQTGGRNSPVSYNRILSDKQFWDGRAGTLEDQAVGPIANPIEMGNTHEACVLCLQGVDGYKLQFDKIFGKMDIDAVGQALASFERAIVTGPAPFDYAEALKPFEQLDAEDIAADEELKARYDEIKAGAAAHPLTESAKRGMDLYFSEKASCSACHVGANLTDEKYHNLGVGMEKATPDVGRFEVTKDEKDTGAFKTPTIRNVASSAPYMHDGSQKTLEEVVEWYAKGGHPNPHLSEKIKKLDLTEQDKKDLVEFMKQGATGSFPKIARGRLPE